MQILTAILVLGMIGVAGALALYVLARKFRVEEDPRIDRFEALLPGANCGACGCNGCRDAAVRCVKAGSIDGFFCPGAGEEGMKSLAALLGSEASVRKPHIAVVKCAGTSETKTRLNASYRGPRSCAVMSMTPGDYTCPSSCLGCGDCVEACPFGALSIGAGSLPEVDPEKCTGCGKCVLACPRHIMDLRPRGPRERRVWVACSNCLKGAISRKQCTVGCIGCGLCARTCPFGAIEIRDNLAFIDPEKCRTCGKCVPVCPVSAIHSVNIAIKPKE